MFSAFQTFGKLGALASSVARAWSPLALWPDGIATPGMWISPRDLTSQWQDYTGTTPVSTPGTVADSSNPVGLILDRKGGLALGAELVTNGDFSNGATGWTITGGSVSSGQATYDGTSGVFYLTETLVGLIAGRTYLLEFDVSLSSSTVTAYVRLNGNSNTASILINNPVIARKSLYVVATSGAPGNFQLLTPGLGTQQLVFDNISVKEIPGIHLSQATSAARPVASARKNELLATAALATQNVTVAAIPYTISFAGAGTITASGTHVGALTNGQTFTPTAGTLTLTVAGSVTTAQLERGSVATTYQAVVSASSYTASAGPTYLKFDGVDDSLASATFAAGTLINGVDCMIAVRRDSSASCVAGLYNGVADATKFFGMAESASGSGCVGSGAGTPTVWVDNTQLTGGTAVTRGTLHTALTVGDWHILEFRNLDLSTWTAAGFGLYTSYLFPGPRGDILLYPSTDPTEDKDAARQWLADYYGVTLP